jgi:1,2-diacylglycerol 3-alpha-glucosyltransferase
MRIGIFTDRYLPQIDGVAFSIETFRVEMERLGHEVYVFAPRPSWRYKEQSSRIIRFAAVKGLFFDDYLTSFFFPPAAMKQVEKLHLDVVHFQTPSQIGLLGAYYAIRNKIPLVTTYHTDLFEYVKHYPQVLPGTIALAMLAPVITGGGMGEYRQVMSSITPERSVDRWNQKIVVRGLTLLHDHCNLVIVPSKKIERQLKSWRTKSRIEVLPTGVDKIVTTRRDITDARKKFGLADTDQVVLFVGRIGTEKNIGLLIDAFVLVAKKNPRAKLVIAGNGDDIDKFRAQAAGTPYADRIVFTGYIDRHKLGGLYGASSVLGFPSRTDTQGMVVNEAACAGLPIVMVDTQISEVVINHDNGLFARPTARDFAAKLTKILNDPKLHAKMSERSMELASHVSAGKQAVKLLRLYEETIEKYRDTNAKITSPSRQL